MDSPDGIASTATAKSSSRVRSSLAMVSECSTNGTMQAPSTVRPGSIALSTPEKSGVVTAATRSPKWVKNTGPPSIATVTLLGGDATWSEATSAPLLATRSPVTVSPGRSIVSSNWRNGGVAPRPPSASTARKPPPRSTSSFPPVRSEPASAASLRRACRSTSTAEPLRLLFAPQPPTAPGKAIVSRNRRPGSTLYGAMVSTARLTTAPAGNRRSTSRRSRSNGSSLPLCSVRTRIASPLGRPAVRPSAAPSP